MARRLFVVVSVLCGALVLPQTLWAETEQYQIAASADDTYCRSSGTYYAASTMYFPYTSTDRRVFLRWELDIPDGATITEAYLKVRSQGDKGDSNPSTVRLQLVDDDDCPAFSTNPYSWSVTSGYVDWQLPAAWTAGTWYTSGDVKTIVQEFVDRSGYVAGNYLGLRCENAAGTWKQAYQWDNDPNDGPILDVTYATNQPPVADAGSDQEVTDTDDSGSETVTLDGSASSDSDGSITSWVWTEGTSQVATGETAQVSLAVGVHNITLTVTDDDSATDDDAVQITVNEKPSETEVDYQIAASADDTYCRSSGTYYAASTMYFPYTSTDRRVFLRWELDIPDGATITEAYLKVRSQGDKGDSNPSTVRLQLVDDDDCPAFSTNPYSWSVTSGYVDWQLPAAWTAGTWYTSGDVKTIVQEFVDRSGYVAGNYLGLRCENAAGTWKQAYQWDNDPNDGPILEVTYTTGGNQPPVADAGSDQEVTDTDDSGSETVTLDGSASSDSDGSITSWVWTEGTSQVATGETAQVSLAVGVHNITLTVTDDDSATDDDAVQVTVNPKPNDPPVADAGSDQEVTDTDDSGSETVTLDGSASSDSDGSITSWVWTEGASQVATGETAQVSLAVGVHNITLTVTDDDSATDDDAVQVTVNPKPNDPPVADAGSDQEVTDTDDSGSETVTLDGSASSDSDGSITSWVWTEGASQVATGETAQVSLAVGVHDITLTVTDDDSATDDDAVQVTVNSRTTAEHQTAASADDTYCNSSGTYYAVSAMYFPYRTTDRRAFVRWSLNVPTGATITEAYVKVKSTGGAGDSNPSTARLQLVDDDDCPAFSSNPYSWSVTLGYVDWQLPGTWTADQWYTSGDVKTIVQEFVDRSGYIAGNYLGLRCENAAGTWKQAYQWDNDPEDGPILVVTYLGGNFPPVADAGSDQEVTDSDDDGSETVTLDGSGSSDTDGTITSWVWTEGTSQIATGETAQASLAVGVHTIALVVTDNDAATDSDEVTVTVRGATFYVDFDGGSDASAGMSTATAWKHCPGDPDATGVPASTNLLAGDTVVFKGGVVYRGNINVNWSGTSGSPITYDGNTADDWGAGRAIIDGSEPLTGWTQCQSAAEAGGNPNWEDIWYAYAPAGTASTTSNLYENDTMCWMAQQPNQPDPFHMYDRDYFFTVACENVTTTSIVDAVNLNQSDASHWDGAWVMVWVVPNVVDYREILSFDPNEDKITYAATGDPYTDRDERYALFNSIHLIDVSGEYYFNDTAEGNGTHKVWLWPHTTGNPNNEDITVSVRKVGFNASTTRSNVTIQGFKIQKFSGGPSTSEGLGVRWYSGSTASTDVQVLDNHVFGIRHGGGARRGYGAVHFHNCEDSLVRDNTIEEMALNMGILIGGDSTNVSVEDNYLYKCGSQSIWFMNAYNSDILGNEVYDGRGAHANGISVYQNSSNILVAGNTVIDSKIAITTGSSTNVTVCYNVCRARADTYVMADWGDSTNVKIHNNTFVRDNDKPALTVSGSTSYEAKNNLMTWSSPAGEDGDSTRNYHFLPSQLSTLFVDPNNDDYHVKTGSPVINRGLDLGYTEDHDGVSVPQGSDPEIGAYEYQP